MSDVSDPDLAEQFLERFNCTATWTRGLEGKVDVEARHITSPYPYDAATFSVFLHELGHAQMDRGSLPDWRNDARASRWALQAWRANELPDYDTACCALGSRLHGYPRSALEAGVTTPEEI